MAQAKPDDDANAPYKVYDTTPAITMGPLLLDMAEDSVVIEWMTDAPSDGKVSYGEHALDHEAVPQVDGLVPVGTMHRVVLRGLQPGRTYRYRIASRRVVALRPYWPDRGKTVESAVYGFTTFDTSKKSTSFATMTDTHENVERVRALAELAQRQPVDFVVHTGDSVHYATGEDQLKDKFLEPIATGLQGRMPLLYARGNHEYRGGFARSLGDYLHAQEGRYYYTRDEGPVHLVVVDTGEDKPDATNVYAGLNDLRAYRAEEYAWFKQVLADEPRMRTAPFTVVLGHDPEWGWLDGANAEWTKRANEAKVDLFIAGHLHRLERVKPGQRGNDFTILALGQDQVARVEVDERVLKVSVIDRTGQIMDAFVLKRRDK
ncbi:metallophosphoesterase [Dyella sp. 2RAB6]|uniref:metallophosphoesterase n=1 Tax=Dyella sp. 2RAB6 TaxID=3232992 RepID=UPI003F8EFE1D